MRLRTRTFLLCFGPVAALLATTFLAAQYFVQATVRGGLRDSLGESQRMAAAALARNELRNGRFLRIAGENPALKAGLQILLAEPRDREAIATVEDQMRELGERMGFDLMAFHPAAGGAAAGVARKAGELAPFDPDGERIPRAGLAAVNGRVLELASVPLDDDEENLGSLTIGQDFDLADLSTPAVLIRNGRLVGSSVRGIAGDEAARALESCGSRACEVSIAGTSWMSAPLHASAGGFDNGYEIRSMSNVDAAAAPVQRVVSRVFAFAFCASLLLAVFIGFGSAKSIAEPVAALVGRLRDAERTGELPEFRSVRGGVREMRELASAFDRASDSVRLSGKKLHDAYVEFVGSLANALDARDPYTAGHSRRVSDLSCEIARLMRLKPADIERIRIGALLHDIGKIGVEDSVLRKPARLTEREFGLVKLHPEIGRRILEGVHGFAPYLDSVEFHHENWDGSGYPRGMRAGDTPLDARIIHVADAYDAMTTDRPYRRGMSGEDAIRTISECAGTHFDPEIAAAFTGSRTRAMLRDAEQTSEEPVRKC